MTLKSGPKFFATPAKFRAWLERHHETAPELLVGLGPLARPDKKTV